MGTASGRRLPPRETPFLDPDGSVSLDWYEYFTRHDAEHGSIGRNRIVRSPAGAAATPNTTTLVPGAAGVITLNVDGVDRDFVIDDTTGGDERERILLAPVAPLSLGSSAITGATGTLTVTIDGTDYDLVVE